MFQFPPFAPAYAGDWPSASRVAPFGHPRIKGHLHLPAAFRSLSRPSSPPIAKASTIRPSSLLYLSFVNSLCSSYSCKSFLLYSQPLLRLLLFSLVQYVNVRSPDPGIGPDVRLPVRVGNRQSFSIKQPECTDVSPQSDKYYNKLRARTP